MLCSLLRLSFYFLFSTLHLIILYICIKFLSGHKKCTKGNNSIIKGRVMVLFSAHPLTILYIFMKFSENPFSVLKVTEQTQYQTENYKGA